MTLKTPIFLELNTTSQNADELRLERAYLMGQRSGVMSIGSMAVTQRAAGANMSVDIAAGAAAIMGTENALQGMYHVTNDAVVNVVVSAADATNPRKDLVIVKVRDSFYSGANNDAQFLVVAGTPAASPAEPNLDALGHENYFVLAMIDVPAADTAITDSQITNRRMYASALGAPYKGTSTQRLAATGMALGDTWFETDTGRVYLYSGTAWSLMFDPGVLPPFTPVLRNSGQAPVTLTNAHSGYARSGRLITYIARVIATANSAGAGVIQLDAPVDAVAVNNLQVGTFTFLDSSVGPNTHYHAAAYIDTSTSPHRIYGIRDNIVGAGGMATQLGINDVVTCDVSYPAAS